MRKYKVLLACIFADFGQNGKMLPDFSNASWEYDNIYKPWKKLADEGLVELETYWTDQQDAKSINRLISLAKEVDFIFQVPVTHALGIHRPQAWQIIDGGTPIISFHPDLHLRYKHRSGDGFVESRIVERYDTHTISPAFHVMPELADNGVKCYHMPFGVPDCCDRLDVPKDYDVTFVGQKHGIRDRVVSQLRGAGIKVDTWGHFWSDHKDHHGRPSVPEMVNVFNRSKINLNLRWCSRDPNHGQIKGRDFELMGCGAFMMATQHIESDDFHMIADPGKEFVEYHFLNDLIDSVKYYLERDSEREAIANAFYKKREENLWTTRLRNFLSDWETERGWWNV